MISAIVPLTVAGCVAANAGSIQAGMTYEMTNVCTKVVTGRVRLALTNMSTISLTSPADYKVGLLGHTLLPALSFFLHC